MVKIPDIANSGSFLKPFVDGRDNGEPQGRIPDERSIGYPSHQAVSRPVHFDGGALAAPGRAQEKLGSAIEQLGSSLSAHFGVDGMTPEQRDAQRQKTAVAFIGMDRQFQDWHKEQERNISVDGDGHRSTVSTEYDTRARAFFKTVPDKLKPEYDHMLRTRAADYEAHARDQEYKQRDDYYGRQIKETVQGEFGRVEKDTSSEALNDARGRGIHAIDESILPTRRKEEMKREYIEQIQSHHIEARLKGVNDLRARKAQGDTSVTDEQIEKAYQDIQSDVRTFGEKSRDEIERQRSQGGDDKSPQSDGSKLEYETAQIKRTVGQPRNDKISGIVVHETQGSDTMEGNGAWSNQTNTGAHYYVDKSGKIIQWAPDDVAMNHVGHTRGSKYDTRPDITNSNALAIEIMTREGEKPNADQIAAVKKLVAAKAQEHGLSADDVVAHGNLVPSNFKTDGLGVIDEVRSAIKDRGASDPAKKAATIAARAEADAKMSSRPISERTLTSYSGVQRPAPSVSSGIPPETMREVNSVAQKIGASPSAIAAVFMVESGPNWDKSSKSTTKTGEYNGVSQIGVETLKEMGVAPDTYARMSQAEQAGFYGKWLDHYGFDAKMKKAGIDFKAQPPERQAAILQAFQFAPNGDWVGRLGSGDTATPVTSAKQARVLGSTSISDMEKHFAKAVQDHQPASKPQTDDGRRFAFNTNKAPTTAEIAAMPRGSVMGWHEGEKATPELIKAAKDAGVRVHLYLDGSGQDMGGKFPEDKQRAQEQATNMGISLDEYRQSGWIDHAKELTKKASDQGVYSVEWDNINGVPDIAKTLTDYTDWAKKNGITTKLALKNIEPKQAAAIDAAIKAGKIDPKVLAPYALSEESYTKEDKAAAAKVLASHGISQFDTSDTRKYQSPKGGYQLPPEPTSDGVQVAGAGGAEHNRDGIGVAKVTPSGRIATLLDGIPDQTPFSQLPADVRAEIEPLIPKDAHKEITQADGSKSSAMTVMTAGEAKKWLASPLEEAKRANPQDGAFNPIYSGKPLYQFDVKSADKHYKRVQAEERAYYAQRAKDVAAEARLTGKEEKNANGETFLQRATKVLPASEMSKVIAEVEGGKAIYKMVSPIRSGLVPMDELDTYLNRLKGEANKPGANAAAIQAAHAQAEKAVETLRKAVKQDAAAAVEMTPEVQAVRAKVTAATKFDQAIRGQDGRLRVGSHPTTNMSPTEAHEAIIEARIKVQERLFHTRFDVDKAMGESGNIHVITKEEARQLIGTDTWKELSEPERQAHLKLASMRADKIYGRYGRDVFQDAVHLMVTGEDNKNEAAGAWKTFTRDVESGKQVSAVDYDRYRKLADISPADSFGRGTFAHGGQARPLLTPSQEKIREGEARWLMQDPQNRMAVFDKKYGKGAAQQIVDYLNPRGGQKAIPQPKQPPPPAPPHERTWSEFFGGSAQ